MAVRPEDREHHPRAASRVFMVMNLVRKIPVRVVVLAALIGIMTVRSWMPRHGDDTADSSGATRVAAWWAGTSIVACSAL